MLILASGTFPEIPLGILPRVPLPNFPEAPSGSLPQSPSGIPSEVPAGFIFMEVFLRIIPQVAPEILLGRTSEYLYKNYSKNSDVLPFAVLPF